MACVLISTKLHTVLRSLCLINNATEGCLFDPWNSRNLGTIFLQSKAVQVSRGSLAESQRTLSPWNESNFIITLLQCLIVISLRFNNTDPGYERFFFKFPMILIVVAFFYPTNFSWTNASTFSFFAFRECYTHWNEQQNPATTKWKNSPANLWRKVRKKVYFLPKKYKLEASVSYPPTGTYSICHCS